MTGRCENPPLQSAKMLGDIMRAIDNRPYNPCGDIIGRDEDTAPYKLQSCLSPQFILEKMPFMWYSDLIRLE